MSEASSVPPLPAEWLPAFVRRLRGRRVRGAAAEAALRCLFALGPPALVLAFFVPPWRLPMALLVLLLAAIQAVTAARRAQHAADTTLLRRIDSSGVEPWQMAALGDELATWLEGERSRAGSVAMRTWLGDVLRTRLARLPTSALRPCGRPRLGRWLWGAPLLLLLVLLWCLSAWLSPPWIGLVGGRPDATPPASGGNGQGGGAGEGSSSASAAPGEREPEREPATPSAPPPPPPPPPSAGLTPPADEPSPLLDLPAKQHFVLPEFVGDGPTRRVRMHAAELATGAGPAASTTGGEGAASTSPPPAAEQFQRAEEAALRARHVPPAEQPMVRRFFERLRQAAR